MCLDTPLTPKPKSSKTPVALPSAAVAVSSAVLLSLSLLASARTGAFAFGQAGQSKQAAPPQELSIDGEQAGALTAVIDAAWANGTWMKDRQKAAAATVVRKKREAEDAKKGGGIPPDFSLDIRDYRFSVTEEATEYKVTYSFKNGKPIENKTPQGIALMNNTPVYTVTVRKSDFKVTGMSAVL